MMGSAAERKRIIGMTGPAEEVASFLKDFEDYEAVLDVDRLTPLEVPRVLVAITFDSYRWDSIAQRLTDMGTTTGPERPSRRDGSDGRSTSITRTT